MDGPLELDSRHGEASTSSSLGSPHQGLSVVAHDATSDETVTIYVEADQALEVFRHPFAYAGNLLGASACGSTRTSESGGGGI